MTKLHDIQSWMQNALIHSGNTTDPNAVQLHVTPSKNLSPKNRLAIYQRSYYARLLECLRQQYKALCHALGAELFNDFAVEYLREFPSRSSTLSHLGAKFPDFLGHSRPDKEETTKEEWIDFMIDLARFEWHLYQLFDAEGDEDNQEQGHFEEGDNIHFQKCFSLHRFDFAVNDFYRGVTKQIDPPITGKEKTFVAMCRTNYKIGIFRLLPVQYFLLSKLSEGMKLEDAKKTTLLKFNLQHEQMDVLWKQWKKSWTLAGFFRNSSTIEK